MGWVDFVLHIKLIEHCLEDACTITLSYGYG